ncbi:hypothetical protein D3C73_1285190 [compost metagenome]
MPVQAVFNQLIQLMAVCQYIPAVQPIYPAKQHAIAPKGTRGEHKKPGKHKIAFAADHVLKLV